MSNFELSSLEWANSKFLRDRFKRSRELTISHQAKRQARYELLKAMFQREYHDSENYLNGLDQTIAHYQHQMNQSTSEMLKSIGGAS